jgi:glycosyltransferase involved in cell wall biosynthesis
VWQRTRGDPVNAGRIVVAYGGVHCAYQQALAAQEIGELQAFYCALYDAPKKWGGLLARFVGHDRLASRRIAGLDTDKVIEYPWSLIRKAIRDRIYRRGRNNWEFVFGDFDSWVAKKIKWTAPDIFVGGAWSDLLSLGVAKRNGSTLLHDCPGLHPLFQAKILREAAERAGIRPRTESMNLGGIEKRKLLEYSLADVLILYSDFHRKSFEDSGYPRERLFVSPLWVDPDLWYREVLANPEKASSKTSLKLLFVGSVDLRKGIPFLLKAVDLCGSAVQLTIVGTRTASAATFGSERNNVKYFPPQTKSQLRRTYASHEVLVLPSVGEPFGFVALEAMACGLPVILTQNCGAPVPNDDWRIPAMDPWRLAERIMQYAENRALISEHGHEAMAFAKQFGPESYRRRMRDLFSGILEGRSSGQPLARIAAQTA